MQKTEHISIGRKAFTCDLDAYKVIRDYLDRAEKNLKSDPDREDILTDIEFAMAKHFEDVSQGLVVDQATAHKVIETMGEVISSDTDKDAHEEGVSAQQATNKDKSDRVFKTELYKDHERGILSGVCAGIARTIDINPLWVRLGFVLFTLFTRGIGGIAVYILLALSLRSQPSGARTVDQIVEEVKVKSRETPDKVYRLERLLQRLIRSVLRGGMLLINLSLLGILIVLGSLWSTFIFFMVTNPSKVVLFGPDPEVTDFVAVLSVGLVILIPLFVLITQLAGSKIAKNVRFAVATWCIWTLALLVGIGSSVNTVPNVKDRLVQEQPHTRNILIESQSGQIVHACFQLWGDCRTPVPVITTKRICDVDIQVAALSEMNALGSRSWVMGNRSFVYPVKEDVYCSFIRDLRKDIPFESLVLLDKTLNDEAFVYETMYYEELPLSEATIPRPDRKMWQADFYTRVPY